MIRSMNPIPSSSFKYVPGADNWKLKTKEAGKTKVYNNEKRQTPDQKALRDLAKEAEKNAKKGFPISEEEARILDGWAEEYNVPQHHQSYPGSGSHFPGGNYADHTHIYNIHVPYRTKQEE